MSDKLGPQFQGPLFHGTKSTFQPGDKILPHARHGGVSNYGDTGADLGQSAHDFAFATASEHTAWEYAESSRQTDGGYHDAPSRATVYSLGSHPKMQQGVFHERNQEYRAPEFPVKEANNTKPGHQGTIPLNWIQFAPPHVMDHYPPEALQRLNHPGAQDVEMGMPYARKPRPRQGDLPSVHPWEGSGDNRRDMGTDSARVHGQQEIEAPGMPPHVKDVMGGWH